MGERLDEKKEGKERIKEEKEIRTKKRRNLKGRRKEKKIGEKGYAYGRLNILPRSDNGVIGIPRALVEGG